VSEATGFKKRERRSQPVVAAGLVGGSYKPLTPAEMERIHHTVLDVMEKIGFATPTPSLIEYITKAGGWMNDEGRLCYPRALVEDVLAKAPRSYVLPGRDPKHDMEVGGGRVHFGTGGAAPFMMDFHSGKHRATTALDLYDIARLVDTLDNVHFFWRSVVAGDMPTPLDLDLNTTYACMQGTTKHIGVSYVNARSVQAAVAMMNMSLGGEGEFRKRPFCSISCCHVVSPMRFAQDSCNALESAVRNGMPASLCSAAQSGATSPVTLAGSIVQSFAECLAGFIYAYLIDPNCRAYLATWPFVSDLRTGAMSSGNAELGLMMAGCGQMAKDFYNLPGSIAAGMSDSKIPDAQSGSEKAYTLTLAAHSGSTLILESAGMQSSLMSTMLESYIIDNDMLGSVLRTVRGIEVNDETLAYDVIRDVVQGKKGHFLGNPQTIKHMESDYYYPAMSDRSSPERWEKNGAKDIRERARERVFEILREHYPDHISPAVDDKIRSVFSILLPREAMRSGNGRW